MLLKHDDPCHKLSICNFNIGWDTENEKKKRKKEDQIEDILSGKYIS